MRPLNRPKLKDNPEARVQEAIIKMLTLKGWFVKSTHGNLYQSGFPDLFATHSKYRGRWIEVKLPDMKGSKFTRAQLEIFPKLIANGTPVWILTAATEMEYEKLFKPCNFHTYLSVFRT